MCNLGAKIRKKMTYTNVYATFFHFSAFCNRFRIFLRHFSRRQATFNMIQLFEERLDIQKIYQCL